MARRLPPLETFIDLEERLARLLRDRWDEAVDAAWPAIEAAWKQGNHETAMALVGGIKQAPASPALRRKAAALARAMLAYGAEHVAKRHGDKWFEKYADPTPIEQAVTQMLDMSDLDAPAFAARMIRAEARRQTGKAPDGTPGDKPLSEQEQIDFFLSLVLKDEGSIGLGESTYAARNVVEKGGRWSSDLTANLSTSRLVNYGSMDAMRGDNIREYKIRATLDARTSLICRQMNGKTFEVREGFGILTDALSTSDGAKLRVAHPWIPGKAAGGLKGMSRDQLVANKWTTPPFHPRCRSVVVPVDGEEGRVRISTPIGTGQPWETGLNIGQVQTVGELAQTVPLWDLAEGGGIMRALRGAGHLTQLQSWEIDNLGELVVSTLRNNSLIGRINVKDAENIVSNLVRSAMPQADSNAVLGAVLPEIRALVGNDIGLYG